MDIDGRDKERVFVEKWWEEIRFIRGSHHPKGPVAQEKKKQMFEELTELIDEAVSKTVIQCKYDKI